MYRVGGAVHLAPGPGRVRVTHRLAVEHCIFPLVFVLAPLVAGDVRLCCEGKNKTERLVGRVVGGRRSKMVLLLPGGVMKRSTIISLLEDDNAFVSNCCLICSCMGACRTAVDK